MLRPPQSPLSPLPSLASRRTSRQLPLPLPLAGPPAGGGSPALVPAAPGLADRPLHAVWASLSPAMRAQVRGARGRVLQEVVRDARRG
jgi:hypothetical protein